MGGRDIGPASAPAILYAAPVERFMDISAAQGANMLFLAVVAIWRVALDGRFLRGPAGLSGLSALIAVLLPLALIVLTLTIFNYEQAVFDIMAGISRDRQTSADAACVVVTRRWSAPKNRVAESGQTPADRPDWR